MNVALLPVLEMKQASVDDVAEDGCVQAADTTGAIQNQLQTSTLR